MTKILVTGGAGFIGSNFIRHILHTYPDYRIINLDALTYAGNTENIKDIESYPRYGFVKGDICDAKTVNFLASKRPDAIIHFAAESHVDRSIHNSDAFIRTNVLGTKTLLDVALRYGIERFIHVSTDEVYGSILEGSFSETHPVEPNSPYAASKAASDLLTLSYKETFNLPVIITRSSNNFGPYQHPEKFIPLFVTNLLENKKVPLYGNGLNVRDWLYVLDNCEAIDHVLHQGKVGEVYNIGGGNEKTNVDITQFLVDELGKDRDLIEYVKDRPGHDARYSLDFSKLREVGWHPRHAFKEALRDTIAWYKNNEGWWRKIKSGAYQEYYKEQYQPL